MKKRNKDQNFRDFRKKILSSERSLLTVKSEALLSVALVFPNSYSVGMANLGFQAVYRLFNEFEGVSCERAFFYDQFPTVTKTIESGKELREFDVVAFSVSFELDLPNIVHLLIHAGITPLREQRHVKEPVIMAGGAVSFLNPAPLAPFVDFMVLGEVETQLPALLNELIHYRGDRLDKFELLENIQQIAGIYIPDFTESTQKVEKIHYPIKIKRSKPQYSVITTPKSHFKNMFLTEVGRGCGRRCHFCASSYIYHPFRLYPVEKIFQTIENYSHNTRRIGLVGSALSDYPELFHLCEVLVNQNYELGLSSFRLDMISPQFLNLLEKGKVNSIAVAPEAGSERMRLVINKKLSEKQIITAAQYLADSNIKQIKLYFLIGLPYEKWEDIEAIANLVTQIQQILFSKKRNKAITVSVNTFIPKPWTPFQWALLELPEQIQAKRKFLSSRLKKIPGITFSRKSSREEILQAIFSLGSEEVGYGIYYKIVQNLSWHNAWKKAGVDFKRLLFSDKSFSQVFPWDFIHFGIQKDSLWNRWQKLIK